MRLIDKDKIRYSDLSDGRVPDGVWCAWKDKIDNMPVVKAIPIEWIEKWMLDNWELECNYGIEQMIEDWEKENETKTN